jgi:hypothetical protein
MSVEAKLSEWNLELPPAPKPVSVYRPIFLVR